MSQTGGKLTRETHTAIVLYTQPKPYWKITEYCLNELGAKYILQGKFQTDSLEARLGQYRQLAGGKYDVSLRQVFECEKKFRALSVLKLSIQDRKLTFENFSLNWDTYENASTLDQQFPIKVTSEEVDEAKKKAACFDFISGYFCYVVDKKLKCGNCKERITCSNVHTLAFQASYGARQSEKFWYGINDKASMGKYGKELGEYREFGEVWMVGESGTCW